MPRTTKKKKTTKASVAAAILAKKKKKVISTPRKKKNIANAAAKKKAANKKNTVSPKTMTKKKKTIASKKKASPKTKGKAKSPASKRKAKSPASNKKKAVKKKKTPSPKKKTKKKKGGEEEEDDDEKKDGDKEKKEGDVYHVRHKSHVVKVERLLLSDALAQGNMEGWSEARKRAYQLKDHNPNAYYYRFNDPGEAQGNGAWKKDEIKQFLKRLKQLGANGQWGIFAMGVSGRVGYQCSNFYRKLVEKGDIKDPNYVLGKDGKYRFLHKKGKNFGKPKRPRIVDPQFSSYKARVKKEIILPPRKPAELKKSTGKHHHGLWLYKAVKVDGRNYKVGDRVWLSKEEEDEDEEEEEEEEETENRGSSSSSSSSSSSKKKKKESTTTTTTTTTTSTPTKAITYESILNNTKSKKNAKENMPAEILRITQIKGQDKDGKEQWIPTIHCRKMYTLKQLQAMDDLQECFNEGKRKYHEKEIFDTFEEIQVNALRIAGKLKCGPFSRRQPKDKNLFFGRFLVSFEAKQVFHRTGPAGDLLSFSNLNAQIRQVLKKRKRAVEVAAWNEYKKQEKERKAKEEKEFQRAAKEADRKRRKSARKASEGESLYEKERKKNISRNQEFLKNLGLG